MIITIGSATMRAIGMKSDLEKSRWPGRREFDSLTAWATAWRSGQAMGQTGFFDLERRLDALSAKGDPLETIKTTVPWEAFRADIEAVTETKPEERKSNAGRKPYDAILKFKIVVLQSLYNLSDDQAEYLIRDRLSFMRFLELGLEDAVPDAKTLWLFREALVEAGLVEELFDCLSQFLEDKGYIARGGQIIDATIVSAPKQHNSTRGERDDQGRRDAGGLGEEAGQEPPEGQGRALDEEAWKSSYRLQEPHRRRHAAQDHPQVGDRRRAHDSQKLDDILDASNTASEVWADSAYRSAEIEEKLRRGA